MFTLTPELKAQITAHNQWVSSCRSAIRPAEPVNPWPAIVAQMVVLCKDIPCGFSGASEYAVDFLECDHSLSFYDHLRERYQMLSFHAQEVVDQFEQFAPLRDFS